MKLTELKKLITLMRKNGLFVYRTPDFEIKLSKLAFTIPIKTKVEVPVAGVGEIEVPKDLLMWSAPDFS